MGASRSQEAPSQAFKVIIALGLVLALGLFTGAGFALLDGETGTAIAWAVAGMVGVLACLVLWRFNPARAGADGMDHAQRDEMKAQLERLHAAGELDEEQLERALRAIEDAG